jgi:hypothetical protein
MIGALVDLIARESHPTVSTVKVEHASEQFPEEVPPRDLLGPETDDEFVEFKALICHMHLHCLTMGINLYLPLLADLPFALAIGEQLVAVGASVQHLVTVLEEYL